MFGAKRVLRDLGVVLGLSLASVVAAQAADLKIAFQATTTSIDPHYATSSQNFGINMHFYDPLVRLNDDTSIPEPWLAESWVIENDTTWLFKLRKDVKFHDGTPFTAEDVKFTYERAGNVPNALTSYKTYLRPIKETQIIDPYTVRIITNGPAPVLLDNLAYILIVSKKHGETGTTADYNSGKAAIGTGPYKFVSFAINDSVVGEKNKDYFAGAQQWDRITLRHMNNPTTRIAALLAGDIDVVAGVPTEDLSKLKNDPKVRTWNKISNYVSYISIDAHPEALASGKLSGPNGEALTENPLANPKVREALRLSVNQDAIVARVFDGYAKPAAYFVLPGNFGSLSDVKPWSPDEARARQLLTEAGWINKFKLIIGVSTDSMPNAVPTAQALAQGFTRIGVVTSVENMPYPVYVQSRNARKLAVYAGAFNNVWGNTENFYATVMHGKVPSGEFGSLNFVQYKNPKFDELLDKGFVTVDKEKRRAIYEDATRVLLADNTIIPLLLFDTTAVTKADLEIKLRSDSLVLAGNVRDAGKSPTASAAGKK